MFNKSGMHRVAESLVAAEKKLGLDSTLINIHELGQAQIIEQGTDGDIQVSHTHFPDYVPHLLNGKLLGQFQGSLIGILVKTGKLFVLAEFVRLQSLKENKP